MADTAHARLRLATRPDHGRLDARFPTGLPDARTYRVYLRGMHRFVADLAAALRLAPEPGSAALLDRCAEAHAWLAADLSDVAARSLPPAPGLPDVGTGDARLGWEYVLAGSAMGARVLRADAGRLGHDPRHGARFLAGHAAAHDWAGVLARIESAGTRPAIHEGARSAFAFADACFGAAHDLEECLCP